MSSGLADESTDLVRARLRAAVDGRRVPPDLLARARERHRRYCLRRQRRRVLVATGLTVALLVGLAVSLRESRETPENSEFATPPTVSTSPLLVVGGPRPPDAGPDAFTSVACPPTGGAIAIPGKGWAQDGCDGSYLLLLGDATRAGASWTLSAPGWRTTCTVAVRVPDDPEVRGYARYDVHLVDARSATDALSFELHQSTFRRKWVEYAGLLRVDERTTGVTLRVSAGRTGDQGIGVDAARLHCGRRAP